jgi:FAD/FMN-containing dehydrogenase
VNRDPRAEYEARKPRLRREYVGIPAGTPVRLAKTTSNLLRTRRRTSVRRLDVRGLEGVLALDPDARTADVQAMTTYEQLVDATLVHGLMPRVVPQLKTITLGRAVAGLGIESSSFRNGLPHESVLELEVLTGDGRVVVARPDNEHRALFHRASAGSSPSAGCAPRTTGSWSSLSAATGPCATRRTCASTTRAP